MRSFITVSKNPILSVLGEARTQIHVPGSWIALFIPFAASQFHELDVQLIENVSI